MKQYFIWGVLAVSVAACNLGQRNETQDTAANPQAQAPSGQPAQPVADTPSINIIISLAQRQLAVLNGNDTLKKYAVAIGKAKYPTPTGTFQIHQIDFNPDWTPPEGDWAKDKKYEKPGSKNNPMGRARIVYEKPYTIHGTRDTASLGEAESHGSIRMANDQVIELARLIMKETGTDKPESWFQQVLADSTKMVSVDLAKPVKLVNKQ